MAFVVAILGRLRVLPPESLDFTFATSRHQHLGFGPFYWRLFICLVCTFFGCAYFAIARLKPRPFNAATGLVGFVLVAFASLVWMVSSLLMTGGSRWGDQFAILLFAAIGCFIFGVVLATANAAWGLLRR
jgi:lipopolysaccharide export LptBFGC system permease protein LptF